MSSRRFILECTKHLSPLGFFRDRLGICVYIQAATRFEKRVLARFSVHTPGSTSSELKTLRTLETCNQNHARYPQSQALSSNDEFAKPNPIEPQGWSIHKNLIGTPEVGLWSATWVDWSMCRKEEISSPHAPHMQKTCVIEDFLATHKLSDGIRTHCEPSDRVAQTGAPNFNTDRMCRDTGLASVSQFDHKYTLRTILKTNMHHETFSGNTESYPLELPTQTHCEPSDRVAHTGAPNFNTDRVCRDTGLAPPSSSDARKLSSKKKPMSVFAASLEMLDKVASICSWVSASKWVALMSK